MPEEVLHSETLTEGYRLTTTAGSLRIDPVGPAQAAVTPNRDTLS